MAKRTGTAADRRARAAAAKAAVVRAERRRRLVTWGVGGGAAVALVAVIVVAVVFANRSATSRHAGTVDGVPRSPRLTAVGRTVAPPWPVPADTLGAVRAAGLPMLSSEGTVEHIHAHLDIRVDGHAVTVPAQLGIDQGSGQISPVHTHDTSGVIHIESPVTSSFSLGQFLTEWQLSTSADHLGGLKVGGDALLRAYVNGKAHAGDPAGIILHAHDEVALVYGTPAQQANPPSTYTFEQGE